MQIMMRGLMMRVKRIVCALCTDHFDAMLRGMADDQKNPLGPVGHALAANVKNIRESQRLTFVALSERLNDVGRPIAVLGLRRIERGERRVDADDLLALANALGVNPVDLLVSADANDSAVYYVTPKTAISAKTARDWIGGIGFLNPPNDPAELADALRWLPPHRAAVLNRSWWSREREAEQIRAHNKARQEVDPEGRGGFYGSDGQFYPAAADPEADRRKADPVGWLNDRLADRMEDQEPTDG